MFINNGEVVKMGCVIFNQFDFIDAKNHPSITSLELAD